MYNQLIYPSRYNHMRYLQFIGHDLVQMFAVGFEDVFYQCDSMHVVHNDHAIASPWYGSSVGLVYECHISSIESPRYSTW